MNIYATPNSLRQIVLAESDELKVLQKQENIYVCMSEEELERYTTEYNAEMADENNIFMMLYSEQTALHSTDLPELLIKKENEHKFSEYAEDIFILDVSPDEAQRLTHDYGVLVLSEDNIDFSALYTHDFYACTKQVKGTWQEVMENVRNIPFNTVLINDRNLFTDIETNSTPTHYYGIDNVKDILQALMSTCGKRKTPIDLFIGFDLDQVSNFSKLSKRLESEFGSLKQNYNIRIELVGYKEGSSFWSDSHNRWIITNYGHFTLEHKVSAFRGGVANIDQDIEYHSLYANGLNSTNIAKLPYTSRKNKLRRVSIIVNKLPQRTGDYKYSYAGSMDVENTIKSRILS